jgi:hypothetical protein
LIAGCEGRFRKVASLFLITMELFDKNFHFDLEVEAFEKAKADGSKGRFIGGFVTTDHMDRQQEIILQEGLDFGPFLKGGWFNDNHDKSTDSLVGYPTAAELRQYPTDPMHKGWYVEGELLDGHSRADSLWTLAQALQKSGKRKLGFSVEGSIDERDDKRPNIVRKATVREVAITRCPVNTRTSLDILAKSLAVGTGGPHGEPTPGDAGPLTREALEGISSGDKKKKKKKKRLTKSSAATLLQMINPKVPRSLAERIAGFAIRHYGDSPETEAM